MTEEYLDIFSDDLAHIGVASRKDVHTKGYWHKTFHCWIARKEKEGYLILFQKRHESKEFCPKLFDTTAAGHILSGETIEEGSRELQEELGVSVPFYELRPLGQVKEVYYSEPLVNKEVCNLFLWVSNMPLHEFHLQPGEVTGIVKIPVKQLANLVSGQAESVVAEGIEVGSNGEKEQRTYLLSIGDLVPHSNAYYQRLFDVLLEKHFNLPGE